MPAVGGFTGFVVLCPKKLPPSNSLFSPRSSYARPSFLRFVLSRDSDFQADLFALFWAASSCGGLVASKADPHCTQRPVKRLNSAARSQRCSRHYDKDCFVGDSIFESYKVRCPQRMVPHLGCEISVVFEAPFEVRDATFPCNYWFRFFAACI